MTISFPYLSPAVESGAMFPTSESTADLSAFSAKRGNRQADDILARLITDVAAHPEYTAACLVKASIHGYEIQHLLLQGRDGFLVHREWISYSPPKETAEPVSGSDLDLVAELHNLRESGFTLRDSSPVNSIIGGIPGRYMQIYLATPDDGEWLSCSSPLLNNTYESNTITRICRALGWQITLI